MFYFLLFLSMISTPPWIPASRAAPFPPSSSGRSRLISTTWLTWLTGIGLPRVRLAGLTCLAWLAGIGLRRIRRGGVDLRRWDVSLGSDGRVSSVLLGRE